MMNSDTTFERHRSRIPRPDSLKSTLFRCSASRIEIKIYHLVPKPGGKSDNFAVTTDEQWKLELPNTLDGTGSEMNSVYFLNALVFISLVLIEI